MFQGIFYQYNFIHLLQSNPLTVRILIEIQYFKFQYNLDQTTGQLVRCDMTGNRKDCKTLTVISRIRTLWHHIKISRSQFEDVPDTGLLSKVTLYLKFFCIIFI